MAPVTNPPPPGNWGPPQPGPQPPYAQGQPPYGPPGQWPAQQGWGPPPQPPKNNSLKWLLIGVAVLLVIAITIGATLLFTRDGGDGGPPTATGTPPAAGDIASANDTGPVGIITEDPTCDPWRPINAAVKAKQDQGWAHRDYSIPADAWTPETHLMHEEMAQELVRAADQTVALAKMTPHRIMRELYEQTIAYWRAYADSIPTYSERDNSLAVVASNTSGALVTICASISQNAAATRGPLVTPGEPPSNLNHIGDPANPTPFLSTTKAKFCDDWDKATAKFEDDTAARREIDPAISSTDWTPEQRAVMDKAASRMSDFGDELVSISEKSDNSVVEDFASLSAQYWRAFAGAIPTYTTADSYLSATAANAYLIVYNACRATG